MNLQSKFGYCMTTQTLNIVLCKRDRITDKLTDGRKDHPNTRCPRQTFQAGGIKKQFLDDKYGNEYQHFSDQES